MLKLLLLLEMPPGASNRPAWVTNEPAGGEEAGNRIRWLTCGLQRGGEDEDPQRQQRPRHGLAGSEQLGAPPPPDLDRDFYVRSTCTQREATPPRVSPPRTCDSYFLIDNSSTGPSTPLRSECRKDHGRALRSARMHSLTCASITRAHADFSSF